jgi:hypothetical protein
MQKITLLTIFILVVGGFFYYFSPSDPPSNIYPTSENGVTSSLTPTMLSTSRETLYNTATSSRIVTRSPPQEPIITLDGYVEQLSNSYRLKPDQRFLKAVAEIHAFVTNTPSSHIDIAFVDQHWQVTYLGKSVGQLPEYPDFQDFLGLLVTWAQRLVEREDLHFSSTPLSAETTKYLDTQLQQFFAPHAANAANSLNELWASGKRSTELFPYATKALTLLVLQQLDKLETAEQLPIKAITLLALTKALTNYSVIQEESLLAYLLGYSAYARQVGLTLDNNDAVRHYIYHDSERLQSMAEKQDASQQTRYLYLLWLARQGDYEGWRDWIEPYFTATEDVLPLLKTGVLLNQFATNKRIARILPYAAVLSLANEVSENNKAAKMAKLLSQYFFSTDSGKLANAIITLFFQGSKVSTIVAFFEIEIKLLKKQYVGPFLDGDTYTAYFRGHFYSGLYQLGRHYLDSLSSEQATTRYAKLLGDSKHPIAVDFQRWYRNLAQSKAGKGDPQRLLEDLSGLTHFGVPPRLRTLEEQKQYFTFGSPAMMQGVHAILPYLDTRAYHQSKLLNLTLDTLLDLPFTERLGNNVVRMDPAHFQYLQAWLGYFKRNSDILTALLAQPDLRLSVRLKILRYLRLLGQISSWQIEQEYQTAWEQEPNNWSIIKHYVNFLLETKQFQKSREIAFAWLSQNRSHPSLKPVLIQTKIAKSYLKEGRLKEAWQTIKPLIKTYQGDAMQIGADVLEAIGKLKQAEKVARALYQRYPDNLTSRLKLTTFYWRQGQYQKAADVLSQGRTLNSSSDWRFEIGKDFVETFAEQTDDIVLQAYNLLLKNGIKHEYLKEVAVAVAKSKRLELADKMLEPLKYRGFGQMMLYVKRYAYRKELEGKANALDWLETKIPLRMRNPVSMIAYREKQDELLWEFIGNPTAGSHGEFVWLMRAAVYLRKPTQNPGHYRQLYRYYKQSPDSHYNIIGRYLLGIASQAEVLALMTHNKAKCEVAYYIGFKAQTERRFIEASNWYRIAIETGLIKNGEYRWAYDQLYLWHKRNKSLSLIALKQA